MLDVVTCQGIIAKSNPHLMSVDPTIPLSKTYSHPFTINTPPTSKCMSICTLDVKDVLAYLFQLVFTLLCLINSILASFILLNSYSRLLLPNSLCLFSCN